MSILKEAKSDGIYFYTRTWSDAGELEQGHFQYESDRKGDVSQQMCIRDRYYSLSFPKKMLY